MTGRNTADSKGYYTNLEVYANSLVEDIMKQGIFSSVIKTRCWCRCQSIRQDCGAVALTRRGSWQYAWGG